MTGNAMAGWDAERRERLLDLLADLQHDLGKYIRLPLSMLSPGASAAELTDALDRALRATRSRGGHSQSARELWADFEREAGDDVRALGGYRRLEDTVRAALAWEQRLGAVDPSLRPRIEADLGAVAPAIRALIGRLTTPEPEEL